MSAPAVSFAAPADVELAENPINRDWIIEGDPQARAAACRKRRRYLIGHGLVLHARPLRVALCGR
jgi:hypothetical protein